MEEKTQKPYINVDFFEDLTGDITTCRQQGVEELGARIRCIREEKGLSLAELSKLTGFDVDFLSDIEANKIQPQLGTVIKMSKALDNAFGRIISGVGNQLYSVTRKDEQRTVSRATSKKGQKQIYAYRSLAPEVKGRHMEALMVQLEEAADEDVSIHAGEEFIYVLSGTVSLKIGGETLELEPGDSAYYLSTTPHLIAAKTGKAHILAVIYQG